MRPKQLAGEVRPARRLVAFIFMGLALAPDVTRAACETWIAKAVSVQGHVEVSSKGTGAWNTVALDDTFCQGDIVRVRKDSRAALVLHNDTIMRLDEHTAVSFSEPAAAGSSLLKLLRGVAYFISRVRESFEVETPFVNAVVEGTEFMIRVGPRGAEVTVLEGRVAARSRDGELTLGTGQSALVLAGQAPVLRTVIRPRNAVRWALYYPPILDLDAAALPRLPAPGRAALSRSLAAYRRGDATTALARLGDLPDRLRTVNLYAYRAALGLGLGRVDHAQADLQRALGRNPRYGPAIALRALIAIVQNDKKRGLATSRRAVAADPGSAASWLALSYARQASFDLRGAMAATRRAVATSERGALVHARLAELYLALGELENALSAAEQAAARNPDLARTQTVLGFARLTQFHTEAAQRSFRRAIELDSPDPLARLGLGLATVRQGDLAQGRREIEIAANLDPNNAVIRSYLGKAYFDEKRDALAGTELAIAKDLDPNDPTPWFYDGIRKQTENRPVDALRDVQKSIALNDNRAVYRSSLLLDQDLAARSASLGHIYHDLGFEQLALAEGWKSVNTDPANYSAHRFLADSYSSLPRHDIARVSELLQSQLLQPINLTPLQPELAESNLALLEGAGPSDPSFSEFNPLFARNQFDFQASGIAGSNDTLGDDLIVTGLHDQLSYSVGQFHYRTDGFRENNDLEHDIYNAFAQYAISPKASFQVELRHRETEHGDLGLRLDPANLFPDFFPDRREVQTDLARVGFRYSPGPRSDFLLSLIYQDAEEELFASRSLGEGVTLSLDTVTESDGYTGEAQYLFRGEALDTVVGAGSLGQDGSGTDTATVTVPGVPAPPQTAALDFETDHHNAYVYTTWQTISTMAWTFGLSYDDFEAEDLSRSQLNPKLGLIWDLTPATTLRFAAFRALKRSLLSNQTVEPTQVAGFNQFFDDFDAADAWRYGVGLDHEFSGKLYGGMELTHRDVEETAFLFDAAGTPVGAQQGLDEQLHRAYLYWTPLSELSLGAEYTFDSFKRDLPAASAEVPTDLDTHALALKAGYYYGRLFASLGANYVHQQVEYPLLSTEVPQGVLVNDHEDFWTADASVGYRLPNRWGSVSFLVGNLFDQEFDFQDRNFQTNEPLTARFIPERTMYIRFTLAF
ncbi:MAG: TonB-dependent receptor domain-containing protein [Gammaproteobacteria bacterium]